MTDAALPTSVPRPGQLASLDALAAIPEEEIWLASQKSARTRRAYRQDMAHFMRTLGIATPEQLRKADHRAVIAWERMMREHEGAAASTVLRRLAALSSSCSSAWCGTGGRPQSRGGRAAPVINRGEGSTVAFSKAQARRLLDPPAVDTVAGVRDRAILSVGLQVGLGRAEIAALTVSDLRENRGMDALRLTARAAGATGWRSTRRRRRASAPTWSWRAMGEDVQKAAGHRDPSTTKLYDRRGYNPEKAASFFAVY